MAPTKTQAASPTPTVDQVKKIILDVLREQGVSSVSPGDSKAIKSEADAKTLQCPGKAKDVKVRASKLEFKKVTEA